MHYPDLALDLTCLRDRVMVPPPHEQPARPYAPLLLSLFPVPLSADHS